MNQKMPNPIDVHVGSRIRSRRTMLKISQEKLAEGLGITFQQVQKYEKGSNRVSASRLQNIATLLSVPISYFFADAPESGSGFGGEPLVREQDAVARFLASREGIELNMAFQNVADAKLRQHIVQLVKSLGQPSEVSQDPSAT